MTYRYRPGWSDKVVDSFRFEQPGGHANPHPVLPLGSSIGTVSDAKMINGLNIPAGIYIHTYIYIYIYTHTHTHIYLYLSLYIYTHIDKHISINTHIYSVGLGSKVNARDRALRVADYYGLKCMNMLIISKCIGFLRLYPSFLGAPQRHSSREAPRR